MENCPNESINKTQVLEVSQSIIGVEGLVVAQCVRYQGKKGKMDPELIDNCCEAFNRRI